jgi:hypothetical protein
VSLWVSTFILNHSKEIIPNTCNVSLQVWNIKEAGPDAQCRLFTEVPPMVFWKKWGNFVVRDTNYMKIKLVTSLPNSDKLSLHGEHKLKFQFIISTSVQVKLLSSNLRSFHTHTYICCLKPSINITPDST